MNRIYKVIYSKARQCAMVVSELAKSSHKNSRKGADHVGTPALARMVAVVLAAGALTWGIVPGVSWAAERAENKAGAGIGIAIGEDSKTDNFAKKQIAIGVGATDKTDGSAPNDASIALGAGAHTYNELGRRAATISFGKNTKDYTGGIAIGLDTYAIVGETSIGQRDYNGEMGDITVSDENRETLQYAPGATSLGSNAYAGGTLATVIGAYNISSSGYNGKGGLNSAEYVAQNLGSTILGTLNTNESAHAPDADWDFDIYTLKATIKSSSSGIANSIIGVANAVKNSNGSIVLGAGNTVSNSSTKIVDDITGSLSELQNWQPTSYKSVNDMAQDLRDKVKSSKSGGSTLVIGGGNTADYTQRTQIIGVNNTVTGTEEKPSDYNMVNAFGTDVTNSSHLYTIGDNNHITDTTKTIVFGDNRYVSNTHDSIIIGLSDESETPEKRKYTTATDATIIGHNANAWGNRSMALGKDVYTTGDDSVAIGSGVAAYSKNSIAIGSNDSDGYHKTAVTDYSKEKPTEGGIAIGMGTLTNASYGTAIGYHAMVTNVDGYALGSQASVSTDKGVAIGYKATATVGDNALALGTSATSSGRDNIAIGTQAQATSNGATEERTGERMALGAHSNVSGYASTAIGSYVNVNGDYSVGIGSHDAEGYASTNVSGARAVGIGVQANVAGESAVGIGDTAIANGKQAVAIGKNANASNEDAFAFGTSANSSRQRALALGASANANHEDSVALGTSALAAGNNALALGTNANVSGDNGIAIGASVTEQDKNEKDGKQHVKSALAAGINSTAIGTAASATGDNSIVIGSYEMNQDGTVKNAQAVARDSMAFGTAANAWGQEGIAFGKDTGAGQNAIALGSNANAWKNHSTAIGNSAVGGAEYGVAIGEGAIVTNRYKDNGSGKYVEDTEHPATDAVAIGHNALANVNGGVALGAGSISSLDSGVLGYDPSKGDHSKDTSGIWKSTAAAVSVGDASKKITRQITNVAAGTQDTDAVNVAQLKKAMETAQASANDTDTHVKAGTYAVTTVKDADGKDTQGVALDVVDKTSTPVGKVTITDVAKASDVGDVSQLNNEVKNATGSTTVVDAINTVNTKVDTVDNKVGDLNYSSTNYVKSGDNVTTSISNLDKAIQSAATEAGKHSTVSEGNNIKVTPKTTDGKIDYKVSLSDDINVNRVTANSVTAKTATTDNLTVNKSATIGKVTINADDKGTIGGLTNKTWNSTKITSGQAATEDQLQAATKNAVNYDGDIDSDNGKTITLREDTTISNVANTTIEQNSKNAVNAGTVYNETRVAKDGNFIRQANTAGENLTALDNQVASNTQNINYLNGRVGELGDRINKVGAGAAALAALHPLDFDPDDKWDFAAGVGNYRNATAAAVGLFYRPNERTMFNLGWTMGDNRNMVNGGFSVKFGKSNNYVKYSKAEMASVIDNQSREIAELKAKDAQNAKDNAEMRAEIEALKKQVEALAAKK